MKILMALLAATIAAPAAVVTQQSVSSHIQSSGVRQAEQSNTATDGAASSQAIWPPSPTTAQGRTAARSRVEEIAANALILDTGFTGLPFDELLSAATYTITVDPVFVEQNASLQFYLPPGYMEIESNAEVPFNEMETVLLAGLRVCYTNSCSSADERFFFQAVATARFTSRSYSVVANGDASLDLSGLENPVVTFTPDGFINTYLVEFPDFTGMLDLGPVGAGLPITVEYQIQARARGVALFNRAAAAINDPFVLDTDPVRQGIPLRLTLTPAVDEVPEPSTVLLALSGVAMVIVRRMNQFR